MKKRIIAALVMIFFVSAFLMLDCSIGFAKTKNKSAKAKTAGVTKKAKRKKAVAKTRSASRGRSKRKMASSKKHSRVYSRGSGSTLGQGSVGNVINYARRFLGVGYHFGHAGAAGFDCSGFTMFVYRAAGIHLPHSASGQANLGLAVSKDKLSPGDLVFFETYTAGISHVGIYIGGGRFIHASSGAGFVTISRLSDQYYASRYRGATRILN